MTEVEIIALVGIFFGCFARTLFPFLKKRYEAAQSEQQVKWEHRYTVTIIFNLFVAMTTAILMLPAFQMPPSGVFPVAFTFGWASQDIMNKVAK